MHENTKASNAPFTHESLFFVLITFIRHKDNDIVAAASMVVN